MQRRKFLATVGSLAAGTAAAIGTGAFTSVSANRTVNVELSDDSSAFLGLEAGASDLVDNSGSTIQINLDGTSALGTGANMDAVTTIGDPDNPADDYAFKITNQGTRPLMFKMNYFLSNTGWIQNAGQGQSHLNFEVFGDGQSMSRDFPDQRGYNQDHSLGNPSGGGFGDASSRGTGYRFDPGDEYYMIVSIDTTGPNASKTDDLTGTAVLEPAVVTTQNSWEPENPPSV